MSRGDFLADYEPVEERLARLGLDHPDGRIVTEQEPVVWEMSRSVQEANRGACWPAIAYWRQNALDARRVLRDREEYIRYLERELQGVKPPEQRRRVQERKERKR